MMELQRLKAKSILEAEFEHELHISDISSIKADTNVSIISVIGKYIDAFYDIFDALRKNKVQPFSCT